jgi:hypothetical protein
MFRIAIAAAFILAATGVARADGVVIRTFHVGAWETSVYADRNTGKITSCIAYADYRSGMFMMLGLGADLRWSMSFGDPRWRFKVGERIPIRYAVDGYQIRSATAVAITTNSVNAMLPQDVAVFDEFRRGQILRVHGGGDVLEFALTSTAALLKELAACVSPPRPALTASAPKLRDPASAPTAKSAENQVEAMAIATDVLQAAGFKGFRFLRGKEVPEGLRDSDAVWSMDAGIGTIRIVEDDGTKFDAIKTFLISSDAAACKGSFASGSKPATETEAAMVFTGCETDGSKVHISYFVVDRKDGGKYVFALALPTENQPLGSDIPDAETATQTLRQATFKVTQ